jgi:hypothetical protein
VREWVILPEPSHLDSTAGVAGGSFTMTIGAVDLLAGPYPLFPDESFDDVGFRCAADG